MANAMSDDNLLTLLWLIPLAGAVAVLFMPERTGKTIKGFSLGVTLITFALTFVAYSQYVHARVARRGRSGRAGGRSTSLVRESSTGEMDHAEEVDGGEADLVVRRAWVPYFNIEYYLGLDGISLSLVMLTGLVAVLACLASWNIDKQVKGYFALFLLLIASMMGVFLALDLFLFYVFFEVMLLPMYFLIGVWGGENREYAAIKFLLYTLFGSVFILVAVLLLYFWQGDAQVTGFTGHSFDIVKLTEIATTTGYYGRWIQGWIFLLFLIGFCVKLPSFPFHTWLPDAHVQAPTPISMILAGVLLKIGGYGLIRLAWPLAPAGAYDMSMYVAALGVFSILYGALVAMAQTDFKKLVAYSSVSHMGYVTLGMAVMTLAAKSDPRYYAYGVNGAMFMMIAHGITSTGMFFLVGVIYERAHTRDLRKLGGLLKNMPVYGAVSFLIFFGSMGLPGLCGFIAEAFVVLAAFNYNPLLAVLAAAAVILTAGYILWTLQRVFLGRSEEHHALTDLNLREMIIAAPLVILTVALGVFPQPLLLSWMGPSVDQMVNAVDRTRPSPPARPSSRVGEGAPTPAARGLPSADVRSSGVDRRAETLRPSMRGWLRDGFGHGDWPVGGLATRRARVCRRGELFEVEGRGRGDRRRRSLARSQGPGPPGRRWGRRGRPGSWSRRRSSAFGGLDVLVNNAGTTHFVEHTDLDGLTESVWDEILQVNLKGTFYGCRAAMPHLKSRGGNVVNIASVAGLQGSGSSIAYAASKGAVITLTKSLAKAFAPEVRVNAVAPGPVQTRWLADHQDMVADAIKVTPLRRVATPEDVADAAVFLADVATLMTGQVVVVDGGRTIL